MASVYAWLFPSLEVIYNETDPVTKQPVQNVVSVVNWFYTATDGAYSAYRYGSITLPSPGQPFVAYEDLTPEIVQGWVESQMGLGEIGTMQFLLDVEIENKKNPQQGTLPPPWA